MRSFGDRALHAHKIIVDLTAVCFFLFCVDCGTQVAVVVDPVQSVKGKVVIDAFRMIAGQNQLMMPMSTEPRQTTSNIGYLKKPTIQVSVLAPVAYSFCLTCMFSPYTEPAI